MSSLRRATFGFLLATAVSVTALVRTEAPMAAAPGYPAPRFPSYLRTVSSVEPLMVSARLAARQIAGRTPLGLVKSGEHLFIVTPDEQDPLVFDAVKRALEERGVKVSSAKSYQMQGLTEAQAKANAEVRKTQLTYGPDGWKEVGTFQQRVGKFLPPDVQKAVAPPPVPHPAKTGDLEGTV